MGLGWWYFCLLCRIMEGCSRRFTLQDSIWGRRRRSSFHHRCKHLGAIGVSQFKVWIEITKSNYVMINFQEIVVLPPEAFVALLGHLEVHSWLPASNPCPLPGCQTARMMLTNHCEELGDSTLGLQPGRAWTENDTILISKKPQNARKQW